ncbi:hypothetical protein GCM10023238_05630 [Streptomyces heliomycini]
MLLQQETVLTVLMATLNGGVAWGGVRRDALHAADHLAGWSLHDRGGGPRGLFGQLLARYRFDVPRCRYTTAAIGR